MPLWRDHTLANVYSLATWLGFSGRSIWSECHLDMMSRRLLVCCFANCWCIPLLLAGLLMYTAVDYLLLIDWLWLVDLSLDFIVDLIVDHTVDLFLGLIIYPIVDLILYLICSPQSSSPSWPYCSHHFLTALLTQFLDPILDLFVGHILTSFIVLYLDITVDFILTSPWPHWDM